VESTCRAYDPGFQCEEGRNAQDKAYKMLRLFFINQDEREKASLLLKSTLPKAVSAGTILRWLSEWSRSKYH
jgi:hypothetical protein